MNIKTFQKLMNVINDNTIDELEKSAIIVSIVDGKTYDEVNSMKYHDFAKRVSEIKTELEIIGKGSKSFPYIVETDKNKYKFCQTFSDMTTAQFIDWQVVLSNAHKNNKNIIDIIDKLMCCFVFTYDVDTKRYEYKSFDVVDDIGNIDISIAYRVAAFFLRFSRVLEKRIKYYLEDKEKEIMKHLTEAMTQMKEQLRV